MWKKKLLKIVPVKNDYTIWHGSELLHKEINMHEMIDVITNITGKYLYLQQTGKKVCSIINEKITDTTRQCIRKVEGIR